MCWCEVEHSHAVLDPSLPASYLGLKETTSKAPLDSGSVPLQTIKTTKRQIYYDADTTALPFMIDPLAFEYESLRCLSV